MNRRIGVQSAVLPALLLSVLMLAVIGCQMPFARTSLPPSPTPILLPAQEHGEAQPTGAPIAVVLETPGPDGTPAPDETASEATRPAEESVGAETPSTAAATPTSAARIMVIGLQPSVALRAAPDRASQVVTTVPGARVLWARATSPDGKWLLVSYDDAGNAAWVPGGLVKIMGGAGALQAMEGVVTPIPVAAPTRSRSAPAGPALPGKVVFQTNSGGDIYIVNADGSGLRRLTDGMDPALSPDGSLLAFARWGAPHGVFVLDLQTGEERRVVSASEARSPSWSADGSRLAFSYTTRSYTCRVSPFGCLDDDALRQRFGGQDCVTTPYGRICIKDLPVQMGQDYGLVQVGLDGEGWQDLPAQLTVQGPEWQPNGNDIVYRGDRGLQVTVPDGPTQPLVDDIDYSSPAWSPDGQRIAVQRHLHDHADIFLLDTAGNIQSRLTGPVSALERAPNNVSPTWSPDGRYLLFLSDRDGAWRLYRMNADGSDQQPFSPGALRDIPLDYEFAAERAVSWGR
jgi:TolB protein